MPTIKSIDISILKSSDVLELIKQYTELKKLVSMRVLESKNR